jgi:crotonobetainyl-CoA:carnitine CoA-transferase CaiB-like acyl-CoA transferase
VNTNSQVKVSAQRFLDNVRVLDLSQYIPGPFATRQLADLGAEVIKIEPPRGDPMRFFMHSDADQLSPIYRHLNRGKRICKLDLKSDEGKKSLTELLVGADILLESFRPGVLARLGFDRDKLDKINPGLIHCAISGYGQTGPYRLRAGHDINYCALSSVLGRSGTEEQPIISYPPISDHAAAMQATIAMLAALHSREQSGSGCFLDISMCESILSWQYLPILTSSSNRASAILDGGAACYNIYQCADGLYISLGAIEAEFWKNFCGALQKPQWENRHMEHMPQKKLIAEVAKTIAAQPRTYWQALLDEVDCSFEILCFPLDLADHPQLKSRQMLTENGPGYPAWINQQPVEVSSEIEQITSQDQLRWNS